MKKIIIALCMVILLFGIACVCASEDANQTACIEDADTLAIQNMEEQSLEGVDGDKLAAGNTWYVNSSKETSGDGKTPETPFKTLNEATSGSRDGDIVMIAVGTYTGAGNKGFIINAKVSLQKYGEGEAIFDAEGTQRILFVNAKSINIIGLTFKNGYDSGHGGAIYFNNTLVDSSINAVFINNNAGGRGGACYFSNKVTNFNYVGNFTGNRAGDMGGANYFNNVLSNSNIIGNFNGNRADRKDEHFGGGANQFISTVYNVNIIGNFTNNVANANGGANNFLSGIGPINIIGNFTNNTAKGEGEDNGKGGANYFHEVVTRSTLNGNFTGNRAGKFDGGANYFREQINTASISGNFADNTAQNSGGANYFAHNVVNFNITADFTNNVANEDGGANCFAGRLSTVAISGTFTNNRVRNYGGANYFSEELNSVAITGTFKDNWAKIYGGANCFNKTIRNTNIAGNFISNQANHFGGANFFENQLINVNITGNFNGNRAEYQYEQGRCGGGANQFINSLINVNIIGNFTNNIANSNGGANNFFSGIGPVNIIGNFTNNTAKGEGDSLGMGGANYFYEVVTRFTLNGNFTNNRAAKSDGGANYFRGNIDTAEITGSFTGNTAQNNAGANYFNNVVSNFNLTAEFIGNSAVNHGAGNVFLKKLNNARLFCNFKDNRIGKNGSAFHFANNLENVKIKGNFINNIGESVIYIAGSVKDSLIHDSVFINSRNIIYGKNIEVTDSWFGNNATDYSAMPDVGTVNMKRWLFLNATCSIDTVLQITDITFNLFTYNLECISGYDSSSMSPIELIISSTNGKTERNITFLNESMKYVPDSPGTCRVTASFENICDTLEFEIKRENVGLSMSIDPETVNYGENVTIILSYSDTATGKINITLKGKKYSKSFLNLDLNSTFLLTEAIMPDEYNVTVTYSGNELFNNATANATLTVKKIKTYILAQSIITVYDQWSDLVATLMDANNRTMRDTDLTVDLNGIKKYTTGYGGTITVYLKDLAANNYTAIISYAGDDIYDHSFAIVNVTINKRQTEFKAENITTTYNADEDMVVILKEVNGRIITNANVIVDLNGIKNYITDKNGTIRISTAGLAAKTYDVGIIFEGNENFTQTNTTAKITVKRAATQLTAENITTIYNVNKELIATLKNSQGNPIIGAQITVNLNGVKTYTTDENGTIKVPTIGVAANNHTVNIAFNGNENYTQSNTTAKVTITRDATLLTAANVTASYNSGINLVAVLTDGYGNPVSGVQITVNLNGVKTFATDENGTIKVPIKGVPANDYAVRITFNGNENYAQSNTTAKVEISKVATKLGAASIAAIYNINKYLVIALKDVNGNPVSGAKIKVSLNGVKNIVTDKNGRAKINVAKIVPKAYTAKITFAGDGNYLKSEATAKVTVKKAKSKIIAKKKTFKKAKKVKKYTIKLKSGKTPIKRVRVTIKIKKKTYKAKTNAKGKATFKIKKLTKKGTYKATIKFKGNKFYTKATKKVKIKIK